VIKKKYFFIVIGFMVTLKDIKKLLTKMTFTVL
jgi:hypothetical protein